MSSYLDAITIPRVNAVAADVANGLRWGAFAVRLIVARVRA